MSRILSTISFITGIIFMVGCDRVFYFPDQKIRGTPADDGLSFEDVHFKSPDGIELHGWYLPASPGPARATVLHLHGNAANISAHLPFVSWLPRERFNTLIFDYRGYGKSKGRVTREGTILDAGAALDYLKTRPGVDAGKIVVFGQSMGGAVACVLASQRRDEIAAVVVDSTFSSYRDVARYHILRNPALLVMAWWLPFGVSRDGDPIDAVSRISPRPLLITHGKADRIAPPTMAQQLFDAAREPKELWLADEMDHMEVWFERPREARQRFSDFLAHHGI